MSTVELSSDRDAVAPDGSEVRVLLGGKNGSMAHFTLPAGQVSVAVGSLTLEELWYFISGEGEMWRRARDDDGGGERVAVRAGVSVHIPPRTDFQFRSASSKPLVAVGVTMPPWPGGGDMSGKGEVYPADGPWEATVAPGMMFE